MRRLSIGLVLLFWALVVCIAIVSVAGPAPETVQCKDSLITIWSETGEPIVLEQCYSPVVGDFARIKRR